MPAPHLVDCDASGERVARVGDPAGQGHAAAGAVMRSRHGGVILGGVEESSGHPGRSGERREGVRRGGFLSGLFFECDESLGLRRQLLGEGVLLASLGGGQLLLGLGQSHSMAGEFLAALGLHGGASGLVGRVGCGGRSRAVIPQGTLGLGAPEDTLEPGLGHG